MSWENIHKRLQLTNRSADVVGPHYIEGVLDGLFNSSKEIQYSVWENMIYALPDSFQNTSLPAKFFLFDCSQEMQEKFSRRYIPTVWSPSIVSFIQWHDSLVSIQGKLPPKKKEEMKKWYVRLIGRLLSYTCNLTNFTVSLGPFYGEKDHQIISGFAINDLTKKDDPNKINWHGQNISRWVFAGAIVYQNGDLSMHT